MANVLLNWKGYIETEGITAKISSAQRKSRDAENAERERGSRKISHVLLSVLCASALPLR
jgi:hypothetical protein